MKKLLLFLTACIAAFGMSACGKNQPAQTTLPPAGAAGSAVTETAQPEETEPDDTVRLTVWVNQSETEITEEMTEAFRQAFPDAAFEITVEGVEQDSCREKVMDSLMDAADLFWISDRDLQAMAEEKALQPVVMSPETIRKRNFDGASEAATGQDGTLYAYPASGSGDPVLYYNSGIFTEEDVQSLEAMCSKAAEGDSRIGWSLGFDDGTLLYSFFAGAGLRVEASEDGKGNFCDWDCPDGEAVCRGILELTATGAMVSAAREELLSQAESGALAAWIGSAEDRTQAEKILGEQFACAKLPAFQAGDRQIQMAALAEFDLVAVNPYSDHVGYAMMLAQWLTDGENQLLRYEKTGKIPVNREAAESEKLSGDPVDGAMAAQMAYALANRIGSDYWESAAALSKTLSEGNPGEQPLSVLLDIAAAGISGK